MDPTQTFKVYEQKDEKTPALTCNGDFPLGELSVAVQQAIAEKPKAKHWRVGLFLVEANPLKKLPPAPEAEPEAESVSQETP